MDTIRFALIGCGAMGGNHLQCLLMEEQARLEMIVEPFDEHIQRAKDKHPEIADVPVVDDYKKALENDDVDAVIIATPNFTHREIACAALEAGKDVLCEKPMATTPEDCRAMMEADAASDRVLQIGLELRYSPVFGKMRSIIDAGDCGYLSMMWIKEFRGPFMRKWNDWIVRKDMSGGSLLEKDCHHFDAFNWMVDAKPARVFALGGSDVVYKKEGVRGGYSDSEKVQKQFRDFSTVDALDNAWVTIEYENNVRATLALCLFAPHGHDGLEFGCIGSEGKMESYWTANELRYNRHVNNESFTYKPPQLETKGGHGGLSVLQIQDFIKTVKERNAPLVTAEMGYWSCLPAFAAQRAIEEKRLIEISELL